MKSSFEKFIKSRHGAELLGYLVAELLGIDALVTRGLENFQAMLVRAGQEFDLYTRRDA
jgi:hypothetical protein